MRLLCGMASRSTTLFRPGIEDLFELTSNLASGIVPAFAAGEQDIVICLIVPNVGSDRKSDRRWIETLGRCTATNLRSLYFLHAWSAMVAARPIGQLG